MIVIDCGMKNIKREYIRYVINVVRMGDIYYFLMGYNCV